MNNLERFKAIVNFQKPDYVPIFGFPGAPGMSGGCMKKTHDRLVETGMPAHVRGVWHLGQGVRDVESWYRYWGTTGPIQCDIELGRGARGFKETRRIEGGFEIIESESGALTRQVIDNDITYSMPEFVVYPVRDRRSWEFYKKRMTPFGTMPPDDMRVRCKRYEGRSRPLMASVGGAYGFLRGLWGPQALSLAFYDDPELIHEMMNWKLEQVRRYRFPLIEELRPEVVQMGEDLCYNHGMLLSPEQFDTFCGPYYREVCDAARASGADLVAVDTDGNAMEFVGIAQSYSVNALFPCEVKAGNDLFALRQRHPDFIFFGWLEKEVINEGNGRLIEREILSKVPPLLEKGGYFPNGDHGIQPLVSFENMCRFMTLLHEVTGNPEGDFPRMKS
jgi:hypothetical protein